MLLFGFTSDSYGTARCWYLDTVSVFDVSTPGTQLLQNPGFDNSSSVLTGWTQYCTSTCSTNAGKATSSSCQSGNCYVDRCPATLSSVQIDFIGQTFSTVIGHIYTISFWLVDSGSGLNGISVAYVDVY